MQSSTTGILNWILILIRSQRKKNQIFVMGDLLEDLVLNFISSILAHLQTGIQECYDEEVTPDNMRCMCQ